VVIQDLSVFQYVADERVSLADSLLHLFGCAYNDVNGKGPRTQETCNGEIAVALRRFRPHDDEKINVAVW
jgi:hypothetical protein